jgi:hypothetical protein
MDSGFAVYGTQKLAILLDVLVDNHNDIGHLTQENLPRDFSRSTLHVSMFNLHVDGR